MATILASILIFFALGLSLIAPIIIVSKWQKRQLLALLCAVMICILTMCVFFFLVAYLIFLVPIEEIRSNLRGVTYFSLIFGLPILAFIQWRVRARRKRNMILSAEQTKAIFN